jgi:hypothetical protein
VSQPTTGAPESILPDSRAGETERPPPREVYGDAPQASFVRRLLEDRTPHRSFGCETTFCVVLHDHTATQSESRPAAKASAVIADAAAFVSFDAADPIGTARPPLNDEDGAYFRSAHAVLFAGTAAACPRASLFPA